MMLAKRITYSVIVVTVIFILQLIQYSMIKQLYDTKNDMTYIANEIKISVKENQAVIYETNKRFGLIVKRQNTIYSKVLDLEKIGTFEMKGAE